jgi:hypothetical protein
MELRLSENTVILTEEDVGENVEETQVLIEIRSKRISKITVEYPTAKRKNDEREIQHICTVFISGVASSSVFF